jgi:hypothetical protein
MAEEVEIKSEVATESEEFITPSNYEPSEDYQKLIDYGINVKVAEELDGIYQSGESKYSMMQCFCQLTASLLLLLTCFNALVSFIAPADLFEQMFSSVACNYKIISAIFCPLRGSCFI